MDKVRAEQLEEALKNKEVGGWMVSELVDFGKSAAVFRAVQGDEVAALKVFDDELIKKYGDEVQLQRIHRELQLKDKYHANMVRILDGGFDDITKNHYILMEYLDAKNLKQCLKEVPIENIGSLIHQLASCAEFLENHGLVHRDIKPENIVVLDNYTRLVLLDFGVLRPVGQPGLTDVDGIQSFVGTLQYSSPEFLLRKEEDTKEGWRALTFYQIGGVLHDLIMRRELFFDKIQPYPRLVNAVQQDVPQVHNPSVPSYLLEAAKIALSKDPRIRTKLLSWKSFAPPSGSSDMLEGAKQRVTSRATFRQESQEATENQKADPTELVEAIVSLIKLRARSIRSSNSNSLPPVTVARSGTTMTISFGPSAFHGLSQKLAILIEVEVLDADVGAIRLSASACFGSGESNATKSEIDFYKGVLVDENVSAALEHCVFVCVDKAQQMPSGCKFAWLTMSELQVET